MREEVKGMKMFIYELGPYQFEVIPVGLMNAPPTFQCLMDPLFRDVTYVRVYLDYVVVFSATLKELVDHVKFVLKRVSDHSLKIKLKKYSFRLREVVLLGHVFYG